MQRSNNRLGNRLGNPVPTRRVTLQTIGSALLAAAVLPGSLLDGLGVAQAAGARYFIRLREVEIAQEAGGPAPAAGTAAAQEAAAAPAGANRELAIKLAHDDLVDALKKRPEVVMELDGVPADAPPARFGEELKRRGIKGYEVTLRILKLDRSVKPPPAGRKFRLLEQSVKLALVGTLFPGEPQLALGGDGESTVQIEVGNQISESQERDVLVDSIQDAVTQAVAQALRKLQLGPMKPPKDPPRRRK